MSKAPTLVQQLDKPHFEVKIHV